MKLRFGLVGAALCSALCSASLTAWATESHHHPGVSGASKNAELADATVKRVDKAKGQVVLAHGALPNLAMDPMTMAFLVKESAWLDQWKPGDKIRIFADMVQGRVTVTRWEPVK